jgi:hypothetical protein
VTKTGDGQGAPATTQIIDLSQSTKKPATKKLLMQLYGSNTTTTNPYAGMYDADFIVVIGADRVPKTTTTAE